ncbi:MAG: DUF342 domain-containing protein [Lachnospiraceae bacterium]|nr:DUF342 domain-containing protein [Lachnospiraceae bacterium]
MSKIPNIDSEITLKNYEYELELCQKAGGDIERYRRLSFDAYQLEQLRLGLEHGIDTEKYTDPSLSWMEMENIRYTLETGVDMKNYINQGYDRRQCSVIREGLLQKLDVSVYAKQEFLAPQMREILKGMMKGLDVSLYAKPYYDWFQMREIRRGLEEKRDVSLYAKPEYKHFTMRAIRKALEKGINLVPFAEKGYQGKELMELQRAIEAENDISSFLEGGYEAEQMEQINNAYEAGLNLIPYLSKDFHGAQLEQMVKGLKSGLDISVYAKKEYSWFQMREIRFGMEDKLDVSCYANPDFTERQMAEIRQGLLAGVDASKYAKVYYEPEQMEEMRKKMEEEDSSAAKAAKEEMEKLLEAYPEEEEISEDDFEMEIIKAEECVRVSPDKMKAVINLSVFGEDAEHTAGELGRLLKRNGVRQGVKKGILQEIIDKKLYLEDVVVAEGREPVNGEDGKYRYFFRKELKKKPKILENGSVDYKNMELFEEVKEGQLLAEYEPATAGGYGFDVAGNLLPPKKGKELLPLRGKGIKMSDDRKKYTAMLDGIVEWVEEGKIEVRNMYTVTGNVDVSTGNIRFQGDVNIQGNVERGFTVEADGNVVVNGQCDGGIIRATKDILIRKGCQGQNVGELHAGGSITGQFMESVKATAGGDITASYLLNCQVKTEGKLLIEGRRGVIIGGYLCAKQGIQCFGLGNVAEIKTTLEVGIDKEDMTAYSELMKKIAKVDSEIKTLEEAAAKGLAQKERDEKIIKLCQRLTKALYIEKTHKKDLLKERAERMEQMTKQRNARIIVSGSVYPGVRVYMNSEPMMVLEQYRNVQFMKTDEKIEVVPAR